MKPAINPDLWENPVFQRVLCEGLAMQDQFLAEPIYAKTGKGYLKSRGVAELQKVKKKRSLKV